MKLPAPSADILILAGMAVAADLTIFVAPMIVGAMVAGHGLEEEAAGWIISAQMLVCALASFALAPWSSPHNARGFLAIGLLLLCIGNFASLLHTSHVTLIGARAAAGIGEAFVNVTTAMLLSRKADPDRAFATQAFGIVVGGVLVYLAIPLVASIAGDDAIFYILAALPAIALPFLFGIASSKVSDPHTRLSGRPMPVKLDGPIIWALAGLVALYFSGNATFIFAERIAAHIGMSLTEISVLMSGAILFTLLGPLVAGLLGTRLGRLVPLGLTYAGIGAAGLMIGYAPSVQVFALGLVLQNFAVLMSAPYHYGLMAALDPTGRVTAISRGVMSVGAGLTPGISGIILASSGDYGALGLLSAIASAAGFACIYSAARRVEPNARGLAPRTSS